VGEKLVGRDPLRGHVITPLDVETSDDAHDAKLAIELGAAELVVDRLTADQLTALRELASAAAGFVQDGRFRDVDGYIAANHAFHRFLVDATRVRSLVEAYEQLSVPDLMARALLDDMDADPHLGSDHTELVDALERKDLAAVRRVMVSHNEHAKATQRAGMLRIGGRL
jgi:benzoate/toluate 1,2-dioxygenase reductase subunit